MVKMAAKKTNKKTAKRHPKRDPLQQGKGKEITSRQKKNMEKIVTDLRKKLNEMEKWRKDLEKKEAKPISAQQSKAILEEIKVPKLPVIKDG